MAHMAREVLLSPWPLTLASFLPSGPQCLGTDHSVLHCGSTSEILILSLEAETRREGFSVTSVFVMDRQKVEIADEVTIWGGGQLQFKRQTALGLCPGSFTSHCVTLGFLSAEL